MSSSLPPAAAAVDLNWQSFPSTASSSSAAPPPALLPPLLPPSSTSSSSSSSTTSSSAVAPSLSDSNLPPSTSPSSSSSSSAALSSAAAATTLLSYLTPSFYQSLFDVDTSDVLTRLRAALLPSPSSPSAFANACAGRPDWYGPVWVSLSLIFVIASGSQLAGWLAHLGDAEVGSGAAGATGAAATIRYDIGELSSAIFVVYAFAFWSPMVLRAMMAYLGLGRGLANAGAVEVAAGPSTSSSSSSSGVLLPGSVPGLVCIWGYSLAPYVPAALLCTLPLGLLQWAAVFAGAGLASAHVTLNVYRPLAAEAAAATPPGAARVLGRSARTLLAAMVGLHAAFALLMKLYFFTFAAAA